MKLTAKQKEKLKSAPVDFLLENKHEFFDYEFYLERHNLNEGIINAEPRFSDPAHPIAVEEVFILLPFGSRESSKFKIIGHYFNTSRNVLTVFFQWPIGDGAETLNFMAVCLKLDVQDDLYVATICHELYPCNRSLQDFGFLPKT